MTTLVKGAAFVTGNVDGGGEASDAAWRTRKDCPGKAGTFELLDSLVVPRSDRLEEDRFDAGGVGSGRGSAAVL